MEELDSVKILAVDDDPTIRVVVRKTLSKAGAQVSVATDGREAMRQFYELRPDLVILDVKMPHLDGWEVCRQIRLLTDVPILFLTAMQEETDIVRGLNLGAVDYVSKPFSPKVLVARVRAALRQAAALCAPKPPAVYQDGYLTIDPETHRVLVDGQPVRLTAVEYRLLALLMEHAGQILTHRQILEHVWGWEYQDSVDYVHVYVSRLRRKLEPDPKHPTYLLTERGMGYTFEAQV